MKYLKIYTTVAALVVLFAIPDEYWWSVAVYLLGDFAHNFFNGNK